MPSDVYINRLTSAAGGWRRGCFSTLLDVLRASKAEQVPGSPPCAEAELASAFSAASLMVPAVRWLTLLWPCWIIAATLAGAKVDVTRLHCAVYVHVRYSAPVSPPGEFLHFFFFC